MSLHVREPQTVFALVEQMPAPVGQLSAAQVGLLVAFAMEQQGVHQSGQTRLH
jgi:hypothetical protein